MTAYEIWTLVISALAAIGTLAAVAIALWAILKKENYFRILKIRASAMTAINEKGDRNKLTDAAVHILIQNKLPAPMKVHPLRLEFERKSRDGSNIAILKPVHDTLPAHSRFEVKFPLKQQWAFDTILDNIGITYKLETSAGDVVDKFPKDWAHILYMALEQNQEGLASEQ